MVKIEYNNREITIPIYEQNAQEINQASYFKSISVDTKVIPLTTFTFTNKVLTEHNDIILWGNILEKNISNLIANIIEENNNFFYEEINQDHIFLITNYKTTPLLPIINNKDEDDPMEKMQIIVSGQLCYLECNYNKITSM